MKLSLAWIFDHISNNIKNFSEIDIKNLITQFTLKSAEIESADNVTLDLNNLSIFEVKAINGESTTLESRELGKKIELLGRQVSIGEQYLIKKTGRKFSWATLEDIGASKTDLFPAIWADSSMIEGEWKKKLLLDTNDYILTIDNKSLTNRPDLWSHRGIAREMAIILNAKLIAEEDLLTSKPIKHYSNVSTISATNPYEIKIESCDKDTICNRFAGLSISSIENQASNIITAIRLAKIDSKPINTIVDLTNYVMFDIGQPMHAFDGDKIASKTLVARCAKSNESIALLDGKTVQLSSYDYVITDGSKPIALAGIMGGSETAISKNTKEIFIESANFVGSHIRMTSTRLKIRTESSSRFEKSLDPNQNTYALLRYLKLLHDLNIKFTSADSIISLGQLKTEQTISLTQDFIQKKIGMSINSDQVEKILKNLGFGVQIKIDSIKNITYNIVVPTYRSKDITIPEDILEEIVRFTGYTNIPLEAPVRSMNYFNIKPVTNLRNIKRELAFGLNMNEVQNYAFYDEDFLASIKYSPENSITLANPLSQVYQRLVTSLVPGLLKNISTNYTKQDNLRFFEYNSIWSNKDLNALEHKSLAGIFYSKHNPVSFYAYQAQLMKLFSMLKLDHIIEFKKPSSVALWYDKNQVSDIFVNNKYIGICGKINQYVMTDIAPGDTFIFELDGNFLVSHNVSINKFKHLHKYQEVLLDISMLAPYTITVAQLEEAVKKSDAKIESVVLLDYFEKPEVWGDKRSVTLRYEIYSDEGTLTKPDIDSISASVNKNIQKLGVEIR